MSAGSEYGDGYGNILHRGKQDKEFAEHPPTMKLNYTYKYPFTQMVMAYMNKYTWEHKFTLTTIVGVKQIDEDEFVYLRRHENISQPDASYERVWVNRKTGTMQAEGLGLNSNGTETWPIHVHFFKNLVDSKYVHNQYWVFQGADKSMKVELFKKGIANTIKAMKFAELDKEM